MATETTDATTEAGEHDPTLFIGLRLSQWKVVAHQLGLGTYCQVATILAEMCRQADEQYAQHTRQVEAAQAEAEAAGSTIN